MSQSPRHSVTDSSIAVGAALWAADIEQKNTQMTEGTAPGLRQSAKKAE